VSAVRAFVGLGSNLGDPVSQIRIALNELSQLSKSRLIRQSALYRTAPWGNTDQPDFVNAVAEIETDLSARQLLDSLLQVEARAGRVREGLRWGPRLIDLDLLIYGDERIDESNLHVPHPRMQDRAFVMVPLVELEPTLEVPGIGVLADLIAQLDTSSCLRMEPDSLQRSG
jgi:2-amino-4-hydroxy-6-hydroxymethyldihydropteridine diphosphokinase